MTFTFEKPEAKKLVYVETDHQVTNVGIFEPFEVSGHDLFSVLPADFDRLQAEDIATHIGHADVGDSGIDAGGGAYFEWREREDVELIEFRDSEENILQIENDLYYEGAREVLSPDSAPVQDFLEASNYDGPNDWEWA